MNKTICSKMMSIFFLLITLILLPNFSYAEDIIDTGQFLEDTESDFKIKDFLKETENYAPYFLKDMDISSIFKSATTGKIDNKNILKKFASLLTSEVKGTLKILITILIIVLIHSLLKAITEGLENNGVTKIVYYVEYILIVTIIMSNFSEILKNITETIENLVGFSRILIPLLMSLMLYTGSIATTSVVEPILLFLIEFIANFINVLIIPMISVITVLIIVSKITDKVQIAKLAGFLKSSIIWGLGLVLTLFVGVLSLEGSLTSSVDGITAKTTKAAVSSLIPVVGKILGDGVDAILGCGVVLKNAVGIVGVIVIIGICLMPIIKLSTFCIMYSLSSCIVEPIADQKIVKLLSEMGGIFKLLLAVLCSVSALLIIGVTLVVKISNSGMMYR